MGSRGSGDPLPGCCSHLGQPTTGVQWGDHRFLQRLLVQYPFLYVETLTWVCLIVGRLKWIFRF